MSVHHTSFGPFVIALPCHLCRRLRAVFIYSFIHSYGQPLPSSLLRFHSVPFNRHYQSHLSHISTWSYLTGATRSFVLDALFFYLFRKLWLFHLERYVHNTAGILMAQQHATTTRLSPFPPTSEVTATSSSSTVNSCTSNVSA